MPSSSAVSPSRSVRATLMWFVLCSVLWLVVGQAALWAFIPDPFWRQLVDVLSDGLYILIVAVLLGSMLSRYQQRKAEAEAGAQAEQLLQSLVRSSPDAIYAKSGSGRYMLVNPEAGRLMRHAPEDLIGQDDGRVFQPAQHSAIRANDLQVMAQQQANSFEETLDTVDGLRTYESIKGPLCNDRGEVIGMFGISRDITLAQVARQQLQASEQRYRALFDASPLPMSVFHRETLRLLAVNQAALDRYGYSRDELLAMDLFDIRPPEEHARLRDSLARHGGPSSFSLGSGQRWHHRRKDGSLMLVEVAIGNIEFEGQPACIGLINDVTRQAKVELEREQALSAVQQSRDQLHDSLARIDDGFVALDNAWVYTYVNPRAARLLGRGQPEDLEGRHIWEEFPEGLGQPFHQAIERIAASQQSEVFEQHFEPEGRWFENRVYPSPQGLSIYFTDITERKQIEQVLRDRAHEFRQLAEQMPALIYRAALDGSNKTLYVSPQVQLLGFTPEEWLADPHRWSNAVHPEDLQRVIDLLPTATSTHSEAQAEYRMRDAAGDWRHFRDSSRRVVPDDGGAPYLQGVSVDITDLIQVEQALKARGKQLRLSEQRFRLAASGGSVWDWNPDTNHVHMGSEFWTRLGWEPVDPAVFLERFRGLIHPEDLPRWQQMVREHILLRKTYDIEFRLQDQAGHWRWLHTHGQATWDETGRAVYMAGTMVEVTQRVEGQIALQVSEAQLRRSELRYRLAASHGKVWDWDLTTQSTDFGTDLWKRLGYREVGPLDSIALLEKLMHPSDRPRWREAVRAHILDKAPYDLEFRVQDASGEWLWLHSQGQAVWDERGRATYMAGTTVDVTERKRAEAQLQASEAYRRQLFEQLADGVLLLDEHQQICDANPMAGTLLGRHRAELVGTAVLELIAPNARPRANSLSGASGMLTEWSLVRADGSNFPAEVSLRTMKSGHVLAVLRDISERRQAEAAVMAYQLELSELTRRLLVQEKEASRRIAQGLHDRVGQTLAVTRLQLDAAMSMNGGAIPTAMAQQCRLIDGLLGQAVQEVRDVLTELRPPLLEEQGLVAALDNEIARPEVELAGVDVLLELDEGVARQSWPADVEYAAFMVAREAITNALLHAKPSLVRVLLGGDAQALRLAVVDDGVGISQRMTSGRPGHLGLVGMRERALAVGADFSVTAGAEGGTRVSLQWQAEAA